MILPLEHSNLFSVSCEGDADAMLMMDVRYGDDDAFADLFHRHRRLVRQIAQRYSHSDVPVDDTVQEVFLRVYRARHTYEPRSKFATWLATIARNVALNAGRQKRRELHRHSKLADQTSPESMEVMPPERTVAENEIREVVLAAMNSLGERHRTAIQLYAVDGYSYREVADEMQISPSAVKSLLHRARRNLRVKLHKINYSNEYDLAEPE